MDGLKKLIASYESWVAANPETVGDLETTAKWASYFIAGRISDSNVVSELVYSLSNVLVFYNDRIIERARGGCGIVSGKDGLNGLAQQSGSSSSSSGGGEFCYRLKVILTSLEYCEVFIEISATRALGKRGKWLVVVLLQLAKAAGRYFLLQHATEQIITSPAIPALNRRNFLKKQQTDTATGSPTRAVADSTVGAPNPSIAFQLKRSGRVVRKVEGAPPLPLRDFNELRFGEAGNAVKCGPLPSALFRAECLYIAKPLIHLASMGLFGQRRWQQFVVSLTLDLASIRLYHQHRHLMSKQQQLEMSRRSIHLLLYLMRSPFYERFTQSRLERVLDFVADNVPLVKLIAAPLREYLPHWQSTYFYLWST